MLKSMTAYGRAALATSFGRIVAEFHCVNRKHLEVNVLLPKELLRYDGDVKKWIAASVGRGQVNVKIFVVFDRESPLVVTPNIALARQIKSAWVAIAEDLGITVDGDALLGVMVRQEGMLLYDEEFLDEELYRQALHEVIAQGLLKLVAMKMTEGNTLYIDISGRFSRLACLIKEVAAKAPGAVSRYRQKLMKSLEEVMGGALDNEERIMREVCVYAERIDVAEELTRFDSHLQQADALLHLQGQAANHGVGKTLEFLVQELNRETNTIGSKSADVDVSRLVIEIKSELERIREQIQNIE